MGAEKQKTGRRSLPNGEKKKRVIAFVPEKMVDALGYDTCKAISENSIIAEYESKKSKKK